jgi:hypothetical protein
MKRSKSKKMAQTPESDKEANSRLRLSKPPSPKRGAFPTPRAEIEKARSYIPEAERAGDRPATEPVSQENTDRKEHG